MRMSSTKLETFNAFNEISDGLKDWLEGNGKNTQFKQGQKLISEGEISDEVFLLIDGKLAVNTTDQNGQEKCLAELFEGSIVGEMTWLEQRPAVASVRALETSNILSITFESLDELVSRNANHAAELQRVLAKKLALQINSQNVWIHRFSNEKVEIEPLRKVLVFFAGLSDQDVNAIANIGSLKRIHAGEVLIHQGDEVSSLYLILAGEAEIVVEIDGVSKQVGSSRRGELLGELTLLLSSEGGATATVQSLEGMELLEINKTSLNQLLNQEPGLAEHFYRSLSCMLSQRSRDQLLAQRLASLSKSAELVDGDDDEELDMTQLGGINRAGQRFNRICEKFQGS
tara:strand:+ start:1402 stop:2430 length:1029 start_codon:yes stop_codon:yes gene_type:complete